MFDIRFLKYSFFLILPQLGATQCALNFVTTDYNNYNIACKGDCNGKIWANPTGNAPFTYSWSTGQTWQNIDTLCSGTYTLTLTDNSGCTISESISLTEPSELVGSVVVSTPISSLGACDGGLSAFASGGVAGYTLEWYDCSNDISNFSWDFSQNMCAGNWGVIFTDMNGCIDTSCISLNDPTAGLFSIQNNSKLYEIQEDRIEFSNLITDYSIINSIGISVASGKINDVTTINIDLLSTGIYFINLTLKDNQRFCDKFYFN